MSEATPTIEVTTAPSGMPNLKVRTCECGECGPFRVYHWFCAMCGNPGKRTKKGYPYETKPGQQGRIPHFRKNWLIPGTNRGVAHEICSEPCRVQYLALIGVVPGREFEEPAPRAQTRSHEPSARSMVVDEA